MRNTKGVLILTVFLSLIVPAPARAQELGTILGTVVDPTGAVVPAAHITVTEADTGLKRTAVTDAKGGYVIPSLRPTHYTFSVDAPGFKKYVEEGIILQANQSLTASVTLQLGETQETVTVAASGAAVDTATSTLNQVVDERRMVDLPLNGRNAAGLTTLVAGSVTAPVDGGGAFGFPATVSVSVNGSRQNQIGYQLDGANNTDNLTNANMPFPFPDALQEFSVQTSNYTAQYGGNSGGMVNIVTKSGTNEIHGDAFEFVRNAVFNARNFFAAQRDQLKRNQFGGTLGGPVEIPHLYNGRDRTFFFFGYQGTRISDVQNGLTQFVPTPAMVNGDFSAFLDASNPGNPLRKVVQLKDPITGQPVPGNILSKTELDPASLRLTQALPVSQGLVNGEVFLSKPTLQRFNEYTGRVDHAFREKDKLTVREFFDGYFQGGIYQPGNLLTMSSLAPATTESALIHETHIFRPNLLNDFRVGFSRVVAGGGPPPGSPGVRDFGVNLAYQPSVPSINGFNVPGFFTFTSSATLHIARNAYNYSDNVSWVLGRNNIVFGGSLEHSQASVHFDFMQSGGYNFTGLFTGTAISDFLTGKLSTFTQGVGQYLDAFNNFTGLYVQDDFHASRRLTLNLGLRYEPYFPWHDQWNRIEQFDIGRYQAGVHSTVFPNALAGELFPGDAGFPKNGVTGSFLNFAPRAGFAYDVSGNGKTSIRGGMGMFYDSTTIGASLFPSAMQSPWEPTLNLSPPPGPFSDPLRGFVSPFPAAFPPSKNFVFPAFPAISTFDPATHFQVPVSYNWNLTLEHQLARSWLVRAAYVGNHGSHIAETTQLNPAVYIPGSALSINQRALLPPYGGISMDSQDINSSYNSLQLTLQKSFSHGFSVLANYTHSKILDDLPFGAIVRQGPGGSGSASPIPWYMPGRHQFDHGPSDFDHSDILSTSYVWQLPVMAGANAVMRHVLGGWEMSGIVSAQSGPPITILAAGGPSQTGLGGERGVIVGSPYGSGACGSAAPCVNYLTPSSFQVPAIGTFGTLGKGSLRGPNLIDWDMGLFKTIPLRERARLQFRAEFFNLLNRVNFSAPNTMVGGAGFGSIAGAGDPRIVQLALKLLF